MAHPQILKLTPVLSLITILHPPTPESHQTNLLYA